MIINSIAKYFENIIAIDTAKTSFQVYVVNQKTNRRRNDKVTRKKEICRAYYKTWHWVDFYGIL